MLHDAETSRHVAAWSYEQVERAGGLVWVEGERFEHLGREWRSRFGMALMAAGGAEEWPDTIERRRPARNMA